MYNNDYIIAVDENGQPYIAHAFGDKVKAAWGSIKGTATKYKDKIPIGNGKFRYVYDTVKRKAGTAAKMAWRSKAGRWIDSHDAGITEEIMRKRLKRKFKSAVKKGDYQNAGRYGRRAAELRDEARGEREAAKASIRRRAESVRDKAKDVLGYDEKERYDKLFKSYQQLVAMHKKDPSSVSTKEIDRRRQDAMDAYDEYSKTAKGMVDNWKQQRSLRRARRRAASANNANNNKK